ncbi:MAG: hypothetical protein FWE36_05200 [Erysipelotrichales bacterium]|nr:hypothetical protein [Erysipelotrichales bacterium]
MPRDCLTCGNPAFWKYPYCKPCLEKNKKEKDKIACEQCGETLNNPDHTLCYSCWTEQQRTLTRTNNAEISKEIVTEEIEDESEPLTSGSNRVIVNAEQPITKCILCAKDSLGKLFCKECYFKNKNKVLFLQINKCTEIILKDSSYEGKHTCDDGHIVKSKSEMTIDDYLFRKNIKHAYEKEFRVSMDLHLKPDFYLQDQKVYLEHWGLEGKSYNETKLFKMIQYAELGKTVICTYEEDMSNPSSNLDFKLNPQEYKEGEINFLRPEDRRKLDEALQKKRA